MRLALPAVAVMGLLVAAGRAAELDPRSPTDPFGRLQPHGEPVKGAFVGLYAGRTNLFFGQPMAVELFAVAVSAEKGPYVNPRIEDPSNVRLELTDGEERPVPFRLEARGYSGGGGHETCPFELWPTPTHAVGLFWRPGTYRLRAVVEKEFDAAAPHGLPGKFRTNTLTFTVAKPGTPLDRCEPDAATRDRVAKRIAALDAPAAAERDAAEHTLAAESEPAVILQLDAALSGTSPEAERRLRAALKAHDERLRRAAARVSVGEGAEFWHWAGGLDGEVSERLRKRSGFNEAAWRTNAARFGPVTVSQDRPLMPEEIAKLLNDLRHADPWVRMLAVRSVPPGSSVEVRVALVERLADSYRESYVGPGDPVGFPPIYFAAKQVIAQLGSEMVEPLIAFARRGEPLYYQGTEAELLGRIGPNPKAREFLRKLLRDGQHNEQSAAQKAAAAWGKDGAELLREPVAAPGVHKNIRRDAIEALGRHGDAALDGPTIHKLLAETNSDLQWAAAKAVGLLRYREALPDLERIARNPKIDQNTRYAAIDGVLAMVDEKTGNHLLMDLTDPKHGVPVRSFALTRLGQRKVMAALPILLEAVADNDWINRVRADGALRGLAGSSEGVGYDPRKPDPKKWREFWEKKK